MFNRCMYNGFLSSDHIIEDQKETIHVGTVIGGRKNYHYLPMLNGLCENILNHTTSAVHFHIIAEQYISQSLLSPTCHITIHKIFYIKSVTNMLKQFDGVQYWWLHKVLPHIFLPDTIEKVIMLDLDLYFEVHL